MRDIESQSSRSKVVEMRASDTSLEWSCSLGPQVVKATKVNARLEPSIGPCTE